MVHDAEISGMSQARMRSLAAASAAQIDLTSSPEVVGCFQWAENSATYGDDQARAAQQLVWDTPAYAELVNAVSGIDDSQTYLDAAAVAERSWSDCMASAGYRYATPSQAADYFYAIRDGYRDGDTENLDHTELVDLEIATAVADQECQQETGYEAVMQQARWNAEAQVMQEYSADVDALLAALDQG